MKRHFKSFFILVAACVCICLGADTSLADDIFVSSDISTSEIWSSDNTYILDGIIFVTNDATLTIEPGTVIRGRPDSETSGSNNPGTLVIARGSKIFANGTCASPIVFTDMDDDNVPGGAKINPLYNNNPNNMITENWGGVILLGDTYIANDTGSGPNPLREEQIEGITREDAKFGGGDDDDSSGSMTYVSIRYGGYGLQENEEINGLTMGAVGRGTTLHHIEVVNNVDDGFEWFGGTVNSKNLITWNIGDDSFDTDRGFRGKVQFGLVVKGVCKTGESGSGGGVANRALEMDGGKDPDDSRPYALSQWRNLTLIGMGSNTTDAASDDDTGIEIRDNARPQIYHTIVMDMGADAVDIEDLDDPAIDSAGGWTTAYNDYPDADSFYGNQQQGFQTEIADNLFYNIGDDIDDGGIGVMDAGKQNTALSTSPIQQVQRQAALGYNNIMVVSSLDPSPTTTAMGIQKVLPTDGFFTPVDYYGAFGPNDDWTDCWSLISNMGVLSVGEEEPSPSYEKHIYFPHIASDSPWETEICVINTSGDQSLNGVVKVYSDSGQEIAWESFSLASNGRRQMIIGDEFTNSGNIGYAVFESDSETVCGYTKFFWQDRYRVAVPAVKTVNTGDIYISHIASDINWWSGVSLLNTTSSPIQISIEFDDGQTITRTLAANEHSAFTIASLFGGQPQPDIHSAVITGASGIVGLELFGSAGSGNQLSGILLKDATSTEIYYPHVASDHEWWTGIVAYNPSTSTCTLTITPYTASGTALATQSIELGSQEKYVGLIANLNFPEDAAWFQIDTTSPITGFELFGTNDQSQLAGYTGVGISGSDRVFGKIDKEGWTGIAFVNLGDNTANIELTAYNDNGTQISTEAITLPSHAKMVNFADNLFSNDISSATYITYSSDQDLVGFQLNGVNEEQWLDGLPGM